MDTKRTRPIHPAVAVAVKALDEAIAAYKAARP